jgi:hypothetical protein
LEFIYYVYTIYLAITCRAKPSFISRWDYKGVDLMNELIVEIAET